jgi:hypothetical protein
MENYFSQLLSRNTSGNPDLLQPDFLAQPQGNTDIEESFVEERPSTLNFVEEAEDMIQPRSSILKDDHQPYNERKDVHYHYLQQYITRVGAEEAGERLSTASNIKQNEQQPSIIVPNQRAANAARSNDREPQKNLQILDFKEAPVQTDLTIPSLMPLLTKESESQTPGLVPAVWLFPPPPALKSAQLQTPSKNKALPSLTIGKILIELLPAKPAPPKTINRYSPFQTTVGKSSPSTVSFGLAQL